MTNFYYGGEKKEENLFIYYGNGNKPCDECGGISHRCDLSYIVPEYNEDPEEMAWTVKLCDECLNSIIHEHDERNFNRRK